MSTRNLAHLFRPQSIAVIGASNREKSVGAVVMRNLLEGGFEGPIMPVNAKYQAVAGVLAYPDVDSLPVTPDMAVICTPPATVVPMIEALGQRGTRAATVLTAGMARHTLEDGRTYQEAMLDVARAYGMRILGPNCVGLLVPGMKMNASFAHISALDGKIAFVSQSGAVCTSVLDWAKPRGIGFSHFISLGDIADVDFGDVLDYLGSDPHTRAILLYIETIRQRRNFMSAARAAARNKPILAIKSGRVAEGAKAAASHTGALAGADHVYDAAFKRAGMLRVNDFEELFAAVETLARARPTKGERLAVLTNGGGLGVMAVDELIAHGGQLAELSEETIARLDQVLPETWSKGNPVDIIGDAPGERYEAALKALFESREVDAVLCMHCPVAISSATEVAEKVIEVARANRRVNLATCWVGEQAVREPREMFAKASIPTFDTPSKAVQAFMHLVTYRRNQDMLMETPASLPSDFTPATATARLVMENALSMGHDFMSEPEAKAVFAAYGIPTVETHIARTPEDCREMAAQMEGAVALKVLSPDITHKSDVGGVVLDLNTPEEVESAARHMEERLRATFPDAELSGFTVQRMARRPGAHELIVGVSNDPIFGPVILFGEGGTAVEVIGDRAVGLPPLNMSLARQIISETRIYKRLLGYRDRPPADLDAICLTLIQVAQLVIDIPEIQELDINPLFADSKGVLAVDARIKVAIPHNVGKRLAIRPYPKQQEEKVALRPVNGFPEREVLIRPIRPEDEPNHHEFISRLTDEDIRFRFFGLVHELPHSQMARLTQIDYDREMAFIAEGRRASGGRETLGVVRTVTDSENDSAEFSIVVRSDLKGSGLGQILLKKMIGYCRQRQTRVMVGQVLKENTRMLHFVESLGFRRTRTVDEGVVEVELDLAAPPTEAEGA
ncbi:bifunctional acetate--CoA ligase family protein/GNAT family N-acetyltransferase [Roseospirillum parvum]|uniref:Acetyltransferase n=1 Tax=Roseospirillum parvum TaxID=83401 RepID=A0A1G8E7L7_9PROT|nr:bifunctional acetate--CoA ligase family protein/GNAT family N-acetyltransferase [Roseospirillum parvum]SDH65871.1 acetyltransferase [Roseospirillum parvum]